MKKDLKKMKQVIITLVLSIICLSSANPIVSAKELKRGAHRFGKRTVTFRQDGDMPHDLRGYRIPGKREEPCEADTFEEYEAKCGGKRTVTYRQNIRF